MTNREALRRLKKLTGSPLWTPQNTAAKMVSKKTGLDYCYLYWLPRNYQYLDPNAHARSSVG